MMWSEDITLEAIFEYDTYVMTVKTAHPILGSVMIKGDTAYHYESSKAFDYLSSVTISAYTKTDEYRFLGWFNENGTLVETNAVYTFTMPYDNYSLYARWDAPSFNVKISKNHENGGTVTGSGPYEYYSSATISATTNKDYTFDGIYQNDSKITGGNSFTFTMPFEDVDLEVRWNLIEYSISYNLNGGENSPNNPEKYTFEDSITFFDPTKTGYTFTGWYNGSSQVSQSGTWNYASNLTLTAHWSIIGYTITYQLNGGTNSSSNPSTYNVESSTINLVDPTKTGYTFIGWTSDGSSITSIPTRSTGDITLVANWKGPNNYQVSVVVNNDSLDSVTGSGDYTFGSNVTLVATPTSDNVFKGWYSDSGFTTLLSSSNPYTFTLNSEGTTIYAKFLTKAEEEEEEAWNIAHGIIPVYDSSTQTVTYGLYPQTNVNDSTLVSVLNNLTTPESNGWYLYEGEYYAKLSATPNSSSYVFDNGTTIVNGTTYWFKCEPIVWNVLSNNDGEYYLLSSVLLDAHRYAASSNNYANSEIRTWLNDDFYNSAFALNNSYIQTTTVDNSVATTNSSSNSFACNNTQDKVFLPSYQDYINSSYGFATSTSYSATRYCKTTDWARARGAYYNTSSSYLYNGFYWTRSPLSDYSSLAWYVYSDGILYYSNVYGAGGSVRPSLSINIA